MAKLQRHKKERESTVTKERGMHRPTKGSVG